MLFLRLDTKVEIKVTIISDTLKKYFDVELILAHINSFRLIILITKH